MRKLLISLIAIAALGTGGAFAQSGFWAGVSGGYPGAQVHLGVENAFAGLDTRVNVGYFYFGPAATGFGLGVDVLYDLNVDTGLVPLDVYVGGGPNLAVGVAALGLGVSVDAFVGAEYRLFELGLPEGGLFFEFGPALRILPGFGVDFLGRVGFNWHF